MERKGYEMLKGIFELEKDWNEYSQQEQKEIVAKKAKEYILGGFPTLSKMNNKTQKEK